MKILVLGTIDNKGGAAQVSWELRKRLKADGHTVSTFVRYKYSDESDVFKIPRKRYQDWLVKLFANDLRFAQTGYIFNTKEYKEADIIHCHNLHSNFFNLKDLVRMSQEKKVVWTIHDLWAITGFASDSVTLRNPNKKKLFLYLWDRTSALLRAKQRIYKKSQINVVAVSEWLKHQIENSILGNQKVMRIYNGVDVSIFKPRDKNDARKKLNLPLGKKIVGFPLKGWVESKKLMESYDVNSDAFFVALGHTNIQEGAQNFMSVGVIKEREKMADYLSALDVLFYPSFGDTFGLTVAEALAVGTPVVTYNTDALPELVTHLENGYIVNQSDIVSAKKGIDHICNLKPELYKEMSRKCVLKVLDNFNINHMYEQYLKLYLRILKP